MPTAAVRALNSDAGSNLLNRLNDSNYSHKGAGLWSK